jgi:hypothetical protein
MLEDQDFRVLHAKSACREPKFKFSHIFLFVMSSFLYQIKPHMETVGCESPLLALNYCGVIALQDSLIAYLSHNEPVWDVGG